MVITTNIILLFIVFAVIGFILGIAVARLVHKHTSNDVGTLAVYRDEEGEEYLFLELTKDMSELKEMKHVSMSVDNRR